MKKRLIINADDYGRTAGVSAGIRKAHLEGVVTSTTCMMNLPDTPRYLDLALKSCPDLGMGVHLNLTFGDPLNPASRVSTLVDAEGRFNGLDGFLARLAGARLEEIRLEWTAQIERFISATGRHPTHLDSHHHTSYYTPGLFGLMLEMANHYQCAIRFPVWQGHVRGMADQFATEMDPALAQLIDRKAVPHPDGFFETFYDLGVSLEEMRGILFGLPEGTFEIMTHPGLVDPDLNSTYASMHEVELAILTNPQVRTWIEQNQITLIHFEQI